MLWSSHTFETLGKNYARANEYFSNYLLRNELNNFSIDLFFHIWEIHLWSCGPVNNIFPNQETDSQLLVHQLLSVCTCTSVIFHHLLVCLCFLNLPASNTHIFFSFFSSPGFGATNAEIFSNLRFLKKFEFFSPNCATK